VACSTYVDSGLAHLRSPAHDAQALAEVLQDAEIGNFTVSLLLDQPEPIVRRQVAAFFADRSPPDTLLAHFSCHGVKDETGQLYFAASDTELTALDATALPAEFVNRQMNKSRSRRIVLLLDCCYSGAFARGMQHRASEGLELHERFEGQGRAVLTASSAMEYAFDGDTLTRDDASPSVFTSAVVQGLRTGDADRDGDGYISVDELYEYVYDQVRQRTPSQTPHRWSFDIEGDLVIATAAHPTATKLPAEVQAALASPFPGARLDAVNELARLLTGRHRGLAAAARDALEILKSGDDSHRVREAVAAILTTDGSIRATQARADAERAEQERVQRQRAAEQARAEQQARADAERAEQERVQWQRAAEQAWAEQAYERTIRPRQRSGLARLSWIVGTTLWALVPVATVGLLAPATLLHIAARLHRRSLWKVFALSVLVVLTGFLMLGAGGDAKNIALEAVAWVVLIASGAATTIIAFLLRSKVFPRRTPRDGSERPRAA
jgi:hypothetical protein